MRFIHLVWRNLTRKKARSLFTFLSILVAFVLFSYLSAIRLAFTLGVDVTGEDRLLTIHKVSLIQPLPLSYQDRIAAVPGVADVTHASWFGGKYQNEESAFPVMPVEPEPFLRLYPEFLLPEEQKQAWIEDRTGAIAGRSIVERYGWKIGDRIPIQANIWRRADGSDTWEFNLRGIYRGAERGVDETQFFFQYEYFNEARAVGRDLVGWYIVRIDDPDRAAEIADRIDAVFANSPYETKTTTEKAFVQGFAKQIGNVGAILSYVLTAVFFTILLVAGNTMAQSVRERLGELAVLKTLGYSDGLVLRLVLAESLVLCGLAGAAGLLIGWLLVQSGDPTGGRLPVFYMPGRDVVLGAALVVALGVASGLLPAIQAMRLTIVQALRSA